MLWLHTGPCRATLWLHTGPCWAMLWLHTGSCWAMLWLHGPCVWWPALRGVQRVLSTCMAPPEAAPRSHTVPWSCSCSRYRRTIISEGDVDVRTQYLVEGLFSLRKAGFEG